jgi:hypothetical protein
MAKATLIRSVGGTTALISTIRPPCGLGEEEHAAREVAQSAARGDTLAA